MKLSNFYNLAIKLGIERDPRMHKKNLRSFPDSALLNFPSDVEVKRILVGIDIEVPEILLAQALRTQEKLDLVLAHHPEGSAYASLAEVMSLQVDMLIKAGVSADVAKELLKLRQEEVSRRILPQNHMRSVDAARILSMPFMCLHTPADNHVSYFIHKLIEKEKPRKVEDIVDLLLEVPEYKEAAGNFVGPRVILGNPKRSVGKIFVEMTGGTEGPKEVYDKLYKKGIRTLISMHLSEEHFKKVKDANLNVVIAGHISSDTLGLNLLLDRVEQESKENFEIICCSGFRRFKRE